MGYGEQAALVAREKRGRVHSRQVTCWRVTDDDCLHPVDSVHAHNLGTCHDAKLTAVRTRGSKKAPPKTSRYSRVASTQDYENPLAALQSVDSGSPGDAAIARDDDVDGPDHRVGLA